MLLPSRYLRSREREESRRASILVCGAAIADASQFEKVDDMTFENWNKIMTANAWTPLVMTREVGKVMPPGGRIVLLSSVSSKNPQPDPLIAYGASKAAMDTIARNMSSIFGQRKNRITVNSISIGPIESEALSMAVKQIGPEFLKQCEDFTLVKRIGQAQEIADIVAFIASPASSFISGN